MSTAIAEAPARPAPAPAPEAGERALPSPWLRWLHLAVLSAFGIAQPLFTEIDDGSIFIVFDFGRADIVAMALAVTLGPPTVLLALEMAGGLVRGRLERWLHIAFVGALAGILASQLLVEVWQPSSRVHALLALAAAVGFAAAYAKAQPVRSILTVLAPLPLVFLCQFLFFSPVEKLAVAGQGEPPATPVVLPAPVVMLVLDEFPGTALMNADGEIDAERFPNFARLGQTSTWFRNATTVHSFTDFALPAILSGRRSETGTLPTASDHPENLFSLVSGNPVTAQEPVTDMCPRYVCEGSRSLGDRASSLAKLATRTSLRQWLPPSLADNVADPAVISDPRADAARFVASLGTGEGPGLHYAHLMLPHAPLVYLPSGRRHTSGNSGLLGLAGVNRWGEEEWPVTQSQQAFLLQLMYTDRVLGTVLDRLEDQAMFDRAMVVVLADHGVSFRAGLPRREVTPENYEDILSVPLFVKEPGQQRGQTSDEFVRNLDVVPTIADVLDLQSPWPTEGRSVFEEREQANPSLDIRTEAGRRLEFGARDFVRRRDAALRRQVTRFGSGTTGLYRIGPNASLIGSAPAGARTSERAEVSLVEGSRPVYDPGSPDIPARVAGTVLGPDAANTRTLAVAVNGRIATTTRTFEEGGGVVFTALLPESVLRRGRNSVRIYAISPGPSLALLPSRN